MQGRVILGTGEPSPIMKRSPSMKLAKENMSGEKLFSSIDLSSIGRTRRNSIPSSGVGRTESRGSVPSVLLGVPGHKFRPSLANQQHNSTGRYRSLKSYLKSFGDQNGSNELSKLDDTLAKIKFQLTEMSAETRSVGERVTSLTQDITYLSKHVPASSNGTDTTEGKTDKPSYLTLPNTYRRKDETQKQDIICGYSTLPPALTFERTHSQPTPLLQINDIWEGYGDDDESDISDTRVSQESQEDFEVKVIHSSSLDNHHMIVVSTPKDDAQSESDGGQQLSDQEEEEDVFDNPFLLS